MIIPFNLKPKSNVLISGCGAGFDVISVGLPIGLELETQGHHVVYSSFTSSRLDNVSGANVYTFNQFVKINKNSKSSNNFLPEVFISKWYSENLMKEKDVYCYNNIGVRPLTTIFNHIKSIEDIDYHFIVDGGVDGLFSGNEFNIATPEIDAISIIAANLSPGKSYYVSSAFGTEGPNCSVSHSEALERMSELIHNNQSLGTTSLLNNKYVASKYIEMFEYICQSLPEKRKSIIMSSIVESLKGNFGFMSLCSRTDKAKVWVSPLTSMFWFFDIDGVAKNKVYYTDLINNDNYKDVINIIMNHRKPLLENTEKIKKPSIPI